jgi:hypothetical protein
MWKYTEGEFLETEQDKNNTLLRRFRVDIFTVQNKKFYIFFLFLCFLSYPPYSAHALCYIVICKRLKYRKNNLVLLGLFDYFILQQHTGMTNLTNKHHTVVMSTVKLQHITIC